MILRNFLWAADLQPDEICIREAVADTRRRRQRALRLLPLEIGLVFACGGAAALALAVMLCRIVAHFTG